MPVFFELDPVSLGQGNDSYEWMDGDICVAVLCRNWRLFIASFKVPYHWTSVPCFSLLRGISSAFTGTSPLWSSLSFISNLSIAPGMIPLLPFFQPFSPSFRCLCSMSGRSFHFFVVQRQSSCSCADFRALLGLLHVSMLNKTCKFKSWR